MAEILSIDIVTGHIELDEINNKNVDVEVLLSDGKRYAATFFTISNIISIIDTYKATGECVNGLYFWATDLIIIESLTEENIRRAVFDLLKTGEFYSAFSCLK